MLADELDTRARLRARIRELIADLKELGVDEDRLRGKNILELEGMKLRELGACMRAPSGR